MRLPRVAFVGVCLLSLSGCPQERPQPAPDDSQPKTPPSEDPPPQPDNPQPQDDPAAAKASVQRLNSLDIRTVYPGHGAPFPMAAFTRT